MNSKPLRAGALCTLVLLSGCARNGAPVAAAPATPVRVSAAAPGPGEPRIEAHGLIATRDEVALAFKIGGLIARVEVAPGDSVHRGQLLASLEQTEIDAQLAQASAQRDKAARDLARGTGLFKDQVISLEQLQNLQTTASVAEAQLRAVQFNRSNALILAPFDGVVLSRLALPHELVQPGQAVLTVGDSARGYIARIGIADRDLPRLEVGDRAEVEIDAAPGQVFAAHITQLRRAADPATGLFTAELALAPGTAALASGMVARVRIAALGRGPALLRVPIGAVVGADGASASVFVLQNGRAVRRAVQIAFIEGDEVALRSGLAAGERVISAGAGFLDDGERVAVVAP